MSTVDVILLLVVSVNMFPVNTGVRIKIRSRILPNRNDMVLKCTEDNGFLLAGNYIGFYRTIMTNDQYITEPFTDFTLKSNEAIFRITPEMEGNFSCVDRNSNINSSNTVVLVGTYLSQCNNTTSNSDMLSSDTRAWMLEHDGVVYMCVM